ncbi:CRP/FNR family transcriptional regulator, anaerobic regulatory protein [Paenibacillus algorifonticola]|uniref:CRP/FNR family transcriptional regulator, anaerobic regulatory protein n=1 Tax=Paenibacillus algorifonticola TaxID=684063 RepID=A0A1I2C4F6_9BACL|nr:Crp/Fnr family transcriptional regulator [Paenibacillus algorifonticola]SFE63068.1 CRP/FNR family transcriptional regulator, anaerobic regulatory protein [Paenibacillus algorifonticola]
MKQVTVARPYTQTVCNTFCFSQTGFEKLKEIMYTHHIPVGGHIFWEGDADDKLYYIMEGRVKLIKHNTDGKEFVFSQYQTGDILGQFDPFKPTCHSSSAKAVLDCTIGVIQKSDLEILLWQHGDLAIEFMKWMGLMHRQTQTKFRDLVLYGKQGALASTLIRLANSFGKQTEDGVLISEKITNTELSDYIGAARESVNRMLGELKKQEVLSFDHGYIVLKDTEHLKSICNCEQCPKEVCRI